MLIINSGFDIELDGKQFHVDLEMADRDEIVEYLEEIEKVMTNMSTETDENELSKQLEFLQSLEVSALSIIFKDKIKQVLKLVGNETDDFKYSYALKIILGVIHYNEVDEFIEKLN